MAVKKEIRNYPLYIRFRYSWLPQGDKKLSVLHSIVVVSAAKEIRNYPLYFWFRQSVVVV